MTESYFFMILLGITIKYTEKILYYFAEKFCIIRPRIEIYRIN